jgi:profilin
MRILSIAALVILLITSPANSWRINRLKRAHKHNFSDIINEHLISTGHIRDAAIIGLDGSTWGTSNGWGLNEGEGAKIVRQFQVPDSVYSDGIIARGIKYTGIRGDDTSLIGRKGLSGIICFKISQLIVIGIYAEGQQPRIAALFVENLGSFLTGQGL